LSVAVIASRIETVCLRARLMRAVAWLVLALCGLGAASPAAPQGVEVLTLAAARGEEAVEVDFAVRFALPPPVEDALRRGIPLHFVARATLLRERWYWRDDRIARATRSWRLSYQPLTSAWRVSQGGLHQTYESLSDALLSISRGSRWRIADAARIEPDEHYYIDFSWGLDTSQLPRPMQIGIGGQPDWALGVERTLRLP
jgi:hypothetical protein